MGNESTPYDGHHPLLDDGTDWQKGNGPAQVLERFVSYGNYAGPGDNFPAAPIDGLDAAAQKHDAAYGDDLGANGYFSWQGLKNTHGDDAQLVADVDQEMAANGAKYSPDAVNYSEGLRGFFGGRVAGIDAVDWAGGKVGQAEAGISDFAHEAAGWSSLGDAGHGIAAGVEGAGQFIGQAAGEAWDGIEGAGQKFGSLGWPGVLGATAGLGDVAVAGAGHVASEAWDGAKSIGNDIGSGADHVWNWLTGG